MTFDDWMRAQNPKYRPTDDTVALRELRDCWATAERHSDKAQERERMIELMRDKCRKVGADGTAPETFAEWLRREMPAGTVIGDPDWWAPKILRVARLVRHNV
jgi:hypothetical protein